MYVYVKSMEIVINQANCKEINDKYQQATYIYVIALDIWQYKLNKYDTNEKSK